MIGAESGYCYSIPLIHSVSRFHSMAIGHLVFLVMPCVPMAQEFPNSYSVTQLRMARSNHSSTTLTWLRSQSLERVNLMSNRVPCITPACRLWLRKRRRWVTTEERLALQGMNMRFYGSELAQCDESLKAKLAGNAFSFHCFMVGFCAALATIEFNWFGWFYLSLYCNHVYCILLYTVYCILFLLNLGKGNLFVMCVFGGSGKSIMHHWCSRRSMGSNFAASTVLRGSSRVQGQLMGWSQWSMVCCSHHWFISWLFVADSRPKRCRTCPMLTIWIEIICLFGVTLWHFALQSLKD